MEFSPEIQKAIDEERAKVFAEIKSLVAAEVAQMIAKKQIKSKRMSRDEWLALCAKRREEKEAAKQKRFADARERRRLENVRHRAQLRADIQQEYAHKPEERNRILATLGFKP